MVGNNIILVPEVLKASVEQSLEGAEENFVLLGFDYNKYFYYLSRLFNLYAIVEFSLRINFNTKLSAAISQLQNDNSVNAKLIIIGGLKINANNVVLLKSRKFNTIYWFTDSVNRFEHVECQNQLFDKVLYHDGGDFDRSAHKRKKWVPYGFNHYNYEVLEEQLKDIDILFTGNLKQPEYKTRLSYLTLLLKSGLAKQYKIVAAVTTQDKHLIKQITRAGITYLGRIPEDLYAAYIKRSKVVVNIMQDDGEKPINPLFFAIPFAKTTQITNKTNYLSQWLTPKKHFYEVEKKDFTNSLRTLLKANSKLNLQEASLISEKKSLANILKFC